MQTKSLPAHLAQVLKNHVTAAHLTHDDELQGIYERLTVLQVKVESLKARIKQNRQEQGQA